MIDSMNVKIPPKMSAIVTHAHSDHFAVMNSFSPTYATPETIDLYYSQSTKSNKKNLIPVKYGEEIKFSPSIDGVKASLIPSGHVLGSASVVIESNDNKLLFSGDVGGKGLLTVENSLTVEKANNLIVEATFGAPEIHFPRREDISMEILKWTTKVVKNKMNAVFSAGRIGSSQELIKIFNTMTNLRVITHGDVTPISDVYKQHGVKLDYFDSKSDEGREILRDGEAIVIQSRGKKIVPYFIKEHVECKTAIVTGMASRFQYRNYDASFPLSSHANFHELLEYIDNVSPDKVFTIYGLEKKMAKAITKNLGIPALPLKEKDIPIQQKVEDVKPLPTVSRKRWDVEISNDDKKKDSKSQFTLDDFFLTGE